MKNRKIFVGTAIAVIAIAAMTVSALAIGTSKKPQPSEISEIALTKTGTMVQEYGEYQDSVATRASTQKIQDTLTIYSDQAGNEYRYGSNKKPVYFESKQFKDYISSDAEAPQAKANLSESAVQDILASNETIRLLVPNFNEYQINAIDSSTAMNLSGGVLVTLIRPIAADIQDELSVKLASDGSISWMTIREAGLEGITEMQKQQLDGQFQSYVQAKSSTYHSYDFSVKYREINGKIFGAYSIVYTGFSPDDTSSAVNAELYFAAIDA